MMTSYFGLKKLSCLFLVLSALLFSIVLVWTVSFHVWTKTYFFY